MAPPPRRRARRWLQQPPADAPSRSRTPGPSSSEDQVPGPSRDRYSYENQAQGPGLERSWDEPLSMVGPDLRQVDPDLRQVSYSSRDPVSRRSRVLRRRRAKDGIAMPTITVCCDLAQTTSSAVFQAPETDLFTVCRHHGESYETSSTVCSAHRSTPSSRVRLKSDFSAVLVRDTRWTLSWDPRARRDHRDPDANPRGCDNKSHNSNNNSNDNNKKYMNHCTRHINNKRRNNNNIPCTTTTRYSNSTVSRRSDTVVRWLLALLLVVLAGSASAWSPQLEEDQLGTGTGVNTSVISQVLNRLTDRAKYDKRLRPRYGEGSVDVGITIHVSSISAVSEVDMDFTLDFYLRQTWHDPRLAFGKLDLRGFESIKSLTVGVDYLDRLWKPDTFFPNEKKSFFHTATTHNSFLRIEPDGRVYTSQRLTVTATCPMELQLFPMDSQACKLEIESYGYTTADISYYWGERKAENRAPEEAVAFGAFTLPQFRRTGFRVNITNAVTLSGVYDRLYIEVILSRNLGFYLMNIIIPSMLIVSISWVSFWLSREASPARVGLGVTTVLTMTTLITTTNNSMPKVSYIKGLDVFLNFCFVMVFASLVEYAVVSYWNKRQCRLRERRRKRGLGSPNAAGGAPGPADPTPANVEIPMFTNYPTTPTGGLAVSPPPVIAASPAHHNHNNNYVYRAPGLLIPAGGSPQNAAGGGAENNFVKTPPSPAFMNIPPDCDCRTIPLMQYNDTMSLYHQLPSGAYVGGPTAVGLPATPKTSSSRRRGGWRFGTRANGYGGAIGGTNWCCRRFSPSKIDRCSRSMFPLLFICFNLFYWCIMTFLSRWHTNHQSFVAFHDE